MKKCEHCGKEFKPKNKVHRTCSRPCGYKIRKNPNEGRKQKFVWWKNQRGYIEGRVRFEDGTVKNYKQHRWIMEQHLGRKLLPTEDVHHINGIKDDNRVENLQVMTHGEHSTLTNNERHQKKKS